MRGGWVLGGAHWSPGGPIYVGLSLRGSERLMPLRDVCHPPFHRERASRAGPRGGVGVPGVGIGGKV